MGRGHVRVRLPGQDGQVLGPQDEGLRQHGEYYSAILREMSRIPLDGLTMVVNSLFGFETRKETRNKLYIARCIVPN